MRPILVGEGRALLGRVAASKVLLAFDFDGTLAPIVAERTEARMRPRTAALLHAVARAYPCAIISGRARADVVARLEGAPVRYVVGNHGLEPGANLRAFEARVRRAAGLLEEALGGLGGVDVEDKRYSLAIHYRRSRGKRAAHAAILSAVAALEAPMRVVAGKLVVNVVPAEAPNKGDALLSLRAREHATTALYVGDDVTDEDVFQIDQPGRLLGVRVGSSTASAARYFLRDQREIDKLLAVLVQHREAPGG